MGDVLADVVAYKLSTPCKVRPGDVQVSFASLSAGGKAEENGQETDALSGVADVEGGGRRREEDAVRGGDVGGGRQGRRSAGSSGIRSGERNGSAHGGLKTVTASVHIMDPAAEISATRRTRAMGLPEVDPCMAALANPSLASEVTGIVVVELVRGMTTPLAISVAEHVRVTEAGRRVTFRSAPAPSGYRKVDNHVGSSRDGPPADPSASRRHVSSVGSGSRVGSSPQVVFVIQMAGIVILCVVLTVARGWRAVCRGSTQTALRLGRNGSRDSRRGGAFVEEDSGWHRGDLVGWAEDWREHDA